MVVCRNNQLRLCALDSSTMAIYSSHIDEAKVRNTDSCPAVMVIYHYLAAELFGAAYLNNATMGGIDGCVR